ncbi:MAG: type II toxin-antitoxin system RelE/ParE family toxin [Campylobacterota bacterium]|nr:type II toxin-antitoxin system RelE/ParE family toxin [Campylobacterota bacterium]
MKFETVDLFDKQFKKLSKKYNLIKNDLISFVSDFETSHQLSTRIKTNLYKTRISNSNKNKGKSAGYRVYYYVKIEDTIYLLSIYDKSEISMIDEKILNKYIEEIIEEKQSKSFL